MNKKKSIEKLLNKRVLILDGAMGTELQKHGMSSGECPELWALRNPKILQKIYQKYCNSGSDVIYTCTFGANRLKLAEYKASNVLQINKKLGQIAKNAAGRKLVAADLGPTGKFVEPFGDLKFEEAVNIYKEQVKGLLQAKVDLFVIETMMDIQEARSALLAVKELTEKFVIVSMTFEKNGKTLNGTDPVTALITLQSLGADAFGCNCSAGPSQMVDLIKAMKPYAKIPLLAKPNAGMPKFYKGKTYFEMDAKSFGLYASKLVSAGANLIGGCCGTTPDHIHCLKEKIKNKRMILPKRSAISAISSARDHLLLENRKKLVKVGECINPTGKKQLQEELKKGKMSLIRELATKQKLANAESLDVNAGVAGLDEKQLLPKILNVLSIHTQLPLVIDSSDVKAIEKALRIYPGRALINSISAEKHKLRNLLPIASKYGAMFILLPLNDKQVPKTFIRRKEIILQIYNLAKKFGFSKSDIVVDGLIMTVSSYPEAGIETLKTIKWAAKTFKVNTICGLSNISFGMPQRQLINSTYLSMLKRNGLSMAICNPMHKEFKYNKFAEKVILNKDKNAHGFIKYSNSLKKNNKLLKKEDSLDPSQKVYNAIVKGEREAIKEHINAALKAKISPSVLVQTNMIPAINKVGLLFESREYFLPQLVASAQTMKDAFEIIKPKLKSSKSKKTSKNTIILATVKGDIHDIGKNIVALLLENHGFNVIDLGKDVKTATIINKIKKTKAYLVGLSALMTTTMVNMKDVISKAKKHNLNCKFILGGAVVTSKFANSVGALYAKDGISAVNVAKRLLSK